MSAKDVLSSQWGRLGLRGFMQVPQRFSDKLDLLASSFNLEKPVLVLGQGEFMHASFLVAQALEARGATCFAQSTTRSPVMVYGAIEAAQRVPDPLGDGVAHYLYNLKPDTYGAIVCLLYTSPSPRDLSTSRMPSSA